MKSKKILVRASRALAVVVVLAACLVAGCGRQKKDTRPEVYPAEGHAYMKDPAFKAALAEQDAKRKVILGERERIFQEFQALEKRAGSREAAEKLAEWSALVKRAEACSRTYESNQCEAAALFRSRVKRATEDSARIARGEARPVQVDGKGRSKGR